MIEQRTRTPIVVGVPSATARADDLGFPVRWAAREALIRSVPLWLAHAYLGSERDDTAAAGAHRAVRLLERTADLLAEDYPDLPVAMFARCGEPVAVLGDLAVDAGLVVVGRYGHGRVAEAVLGSVTAGLSRRASCPVVAVPPQAAFVAAGAPIVVGLDARGAARTELGFAFSEALVRGVPVRLVHCLRSRAGHRAPSAEDRRADLTRAVGPYRDAFPTVRTSIDVVDGEPGEVLTKESVTAGLLVLGPGRGWTGGWRLGRVGPIGHEVLRQAAGPVALMRAADDGRERGRRT